MDISTAKGILLKYGFTDKQLKVMSFGDILNVAQRIKEKYAM